MQITPAGFAKRERRIIGRLANHRRAEPLDRLKAQEACTGRGEGAIGFARFQGNRRGATLGDPASATFGLLEFIGKPGYNITPPTLPARGPRFPACRPLRAVRHDP